MKGNKIQAIIIDDDKNAREALRMMIETNCPEVNIVGEADGVDSGKALIMEVNPDLIFLDVEMHPATGFDLLKSFDTIEAGIIFTTAHDKYAVHAFKISALDYLLKPVTKADIVEAITKFRRKTVQVTREVWDLLRQQVDSKKETVERLVIPSLQGFEIIKVADIIYCEGDRNYTIIHITGREAIIASKTLKEYETLLTSSTFVRVHQKYLVNINHIKKYLKGKGGDLVMANGRTIEVSQSRKQALIDALGQ